MRSSSGRIVVVAAIAVAIAACNRNQNQPVPAPAAPPAASATPAQPQPAPPAPIPAATELPVNTVDSVMLSRAQDEPMAIIIRASGTTVSQGWTDAKLAEEPDSGGDSSVKSYRFVAISPQMPDENRTAEPVEAEVRVEALSPDVKTIRIVSATNEVSAPIAQ